MQALTLILALGLVFTPQAPAAGPQNAAVMATINQFVDGFNKGDTKSALAACADQTSILDEFPPHEWHGAGACARWMADYEANARKDGITDGVVKLTGTRHLAVSGDRAYVVALANYDWKQQGKPMKQTGATFTFVLQRTAAGWRITGWTWSTS
jgi:ketosteroid isomerase-like protein